MKQSKFFKEMFKEAEKNPAYWAEGFKIEILEVLYKRMERLGLSYNTLGQILGVKNRHEWCKTFFEGRSATFHSIAKVSLALGMRPKLKLINERPKK